MKKAGGASQRRFLTGILVRCHSLQILENLQSVLQVTSGKDFTYTRSRAQLSKLEDSIWSMDGALDTKLKGMDMLEAWEWFRKSPDWIKSKYVLGLLSLCDTPLLHMLGNLVHILIVWEKHKFLQFNSAVKDSKSLKSICDEVELDVQSVDPWNRRTKSQDSDSDCSDDPDPALTVVPRSSKSLSGVSRHRDFIRSLPVDIAKRILGLLDKASLYSCRRVSMHWQCLTEEVLTEIEVKKSVEKQAMILQGNSTSKVNPVYAKICEVVVPISEDDKHFQHGEAFPKHKLSQEQDLNSVYKGFKTETVQLEERNVYCGVYNISVLLEREDPSRVMHYAGGQLVAAGSKDRIVRLLHVPSLKEIPPVIQGHAGSIKAVLVCEERDLVISASYDLSIREVLTMSFLFLRIITGCMDGKIRIFNILTGDCLRVIKTNMKQCPVLSLHTHDNTVVVNTRSSILMLQFAEVNWDYSASAVRNFFEQSHVSPENELRSAERMNRGGSSRLKRRSQCFKSLSTSSMQLAQDAQQEFTRAATWSQLQAYCHSRASISPQSDFHRPRSVLSAGRPVSGYRDLPNKVNQTQSTSTSSLDKKTSETKRSVLSRSEKAARDRVRKRGPHHPMTQDLILLRTSSAQQGSDLARSNMELNARVRDAWGPDSSKELSFQTTTKKTSEIHTPITTHSVDLNPQSSSQSRQTCFTPHSLPKQSQRSFKVVRSGINKIRPLNTTSPEDGKTPQRLFIRRTSMPTHCSEDFEMTNKSSSYHVPLNPFREHGVFQLRTDTQLEAYIQECTRQQQIHKHASGDQKPVTLSVTPSP
ncbi:CMT1A duplicated region transcript 1 [Labeo rohita]|uniref:CMT1A duplicated region transcript 1 n=1 Tax=Labeo rohita TaxID=84645 RepID=A0A498LQ07_LABRO|nr:CMT1A duplicated region transcript 1 [Labeo rohita]